MKNLFKTVVLASVVATATSSAAFAGGNPQLMAEHNWEYWNQHKAESSKTTGTQQASDSATSMPKASEYPCGNCVYDNQIGGYVQKTHTK